MPKTLDEIRDSMLGHDAELLSYLKWRLVAESSDGEHTFSQASCCPDKFARRGLCADCCRAAIEELESRRAD